MKEDIIAAIPIAILSMIFSAGMTWGLIKSKLVWISIRVEKLEKKTEPLNHFMGRIEEKLSNIERDVDSIKKKLNIV